ncbi:MAG: glycosyltransferase family 2 protein [Verrucomicrobiaceae bacterium]|nr:glycosyltransferase family 2 protein [Verrucomicrobiaceae bacterium]
MNGRIAVIIPVYNHAHYVGEAIESVLNQTRKPDRVLVIDDGSKDHSLEVVKRYESRGVESFGRENRGAHNTINELVALAAKDCQWINILNSDDRFLPRRLEVCEQIAKANPGKEVISGRLEVIDSEGKVMAKDAQRARWFYGSQTVQELPHASVAEMLGMANFIATTSNVFATADYLLANPFRPYRFNHDYFFLAGAAWRDKIALAPEMLMQYRVHGSNTITTRPEPLMREMIRMHLDLYRHHSKELASDAAMRARFGEYSAALWSNISSFHAGMFQVALAQIVAQSSESELAALSASLQGQEFDTSPSHDLAGAYDGTTPLAATILNTKLDALRADKLRLTEERTALSELSRVRHALQGSKWIALGRLLGTTSKLQRQDGKNPMEKLDRLKKACAESSWIKLGIRLGAISSDLWQRE